MKISILTTITNPEKRQDKWLEALACYTALADEVIVVNGGDSIDFPYEEFSEIKQVFMPWPHDWNWAEYPRHLNYGLEHCTGDWIIRLDIDQLIHEKDFGAIRHTLEHCQAEYNAATLQKMNFVYGKKYFQKGEQPIAFRNKEYLKIGKDIEKETDLCFVVDIREVGEPEVVDNIAVYLGRQPRSFRTGIQYWNYDYFFKTKEFTKREFWRASQAYYRYFKTWTFGDSEEHAFEKFMNLQTGRYLRSPYEYILEDHSIYIRNAIRTLTPEQFGYNGWGQI